MAICVYHTSLLSEHRLSVDSGHSEECDDPHPENSARASSQDSSTGSDDVSGSHLSRNGCRQCLERTDAAVLLAAAERKAAEHTLHSFAEATNLNEPCLDREEDSGTHQQECEYVVSEVPIDSLNDF